MDAQRDKPATKNDLDQVKQGLTQVKQDLTARIDQVEQRLTAKIDANSAKIDANGKKIDANSAMLTRVSYQVIENHGQIDRLLTMSEKFEEYFDEIINTLDGLASGLMNLSQEKPVMNAAARSGRKECG